MPKSTSRPRALAAASVVLLIVAASFAAVSPASAQTPCATFLSQDQQYHPAYSGTLPNLLSTAGADTYIYEATEWGFVRASLANPSSPGPMQLLQIGQKFTPGDNGGLIYMGCDCYQGASTMAAAQAADGTSRIVSDWVATYQGVMKGMLGQTAGAGNPAFGDQLNINQVALGSQVAAIYVAGTGHYYAYFPSNTGVQIVDVTSPNGSTSPTMALNPTGSVPWSGVGTLTAGTVSVAGLQKTLLVGYVGTSQTVRLAEINGDGSTTEKAWVASSGPNSLYLANVNGKAYVFSADNAAGLNVYEYTGTALNFAGNIPGYFNMVVVKGNGGPYPAIFMHKASNPDSVVIYDSKWLASGTPQLAYSTPHQPSYRANAIEAVVTGTGSQITAHLYRLKTTPNAQINPEHLLTTDNVDISCIAADTTSPPTASATIANVTSGFASRTGANAGNFYGDKFTLTDTSSTGVPITSVAWDFNTNGSTFATDASLGTANSLPNVYFPCDPAGTTAGNPVTGANCATSLGIGTTPANASFQFAERSSNQNGPAANPFFSAPVAMKMPQAIVANMSGGVLSVLSGGNADASPSQGNLAEASYLWSFTGGSGGTSTFQSAPVPAGATGFGLTITYPGGYTATTSGTITQVDFVPSFTMNPTTVPLGGTTTLTSTSQKAASTTTQQTDLSVQPGSCPGTPVWSSSIPASFFPANPYSLTAPLVAGPYCVSLRFNYTPNGKPPGTAIAYLPLTVINSVLSVAISPTSASGNPNDTFTFTATASGGVSPYIYQWDCNYSSFTGGNWTTGTATNTCTWPTGGGKTPAVRVMDSQVPPTTSAAVYANVTLTGGGGGGGLSATVFGPSSGSTGSALSFSVSASGGTGNYQYAWACDYSVLGGNGQFTAGSSTTSCTYPTNGTRVVAARVTDGTSAVIAQTNVSIGGGGNPGPSGLAVTVTGPPTGSANATLTYSASASNGTPPYTYSWACDYNALAGVGQFVAGTTSKTCSFAGNGNHVVAARVVDAASGAAINTYTTNITGPGLPSTSITVTGAMSTTGTTFTVGRGQPLTFFSNEPNCSSWGWSFGDNTGGTGRTITKPYTANGTYQVQLIVQGNGTGAVGMNIGNYTVVVVTPPPSGAMTVTGAVANTDGTVFTANVGDEITFLASEPHALSWGWIFGDGATGASPGSGVPVKHTYTAVGSYTAKLLVTGDETNTTGLVISTFTINVVSCVSNATTLCLNDNRFKATVSWAVPDQNKTGSGTGVSLTADTGYFWFFSPANIELVLKVVDGRTFNGKYWVFYGALSDVQYDITIKDMTTGAIKTYHNPYHTTASVADVDAFLPGPGPTAKKPSATLTVGLTCTPSSVPVNTPVSCSLTGVTGSGPFSWRWDGLFEGGSENAGATNTHTYTTVGGKQVYVSGTDAGQPFSVSAPVAVTAPPAGSLTPTISGPTTGAANSSLGYTGSATGGTSPYSYAWSCDYNAASPSFTAGTSSQSCTFTTAGSHLVGLKVTDSATPTPASVITTITVAVTPPAGPGLPSAGYTLDGATLNSVTGNYETEVGRTVTFTATETHAQSWGWAFGDGASGGGSDPSNRVVTYAYPQRGNYTGQLIVTGDGTNTIGLSLGTIPMAVVPCAADGKTLCLNGGRFKVRVDWRSQDSSGSGTAVPITQDTGEFWFLSANNIELVLKVVDGSAFNGHYWVFYGALSNLEYTITVTDTTTGTVKTYHNPLGTTASVADVNAF